jgi:hypothetical protein
MDDLKSVTVSYLRELARKHLGPGYSKLNKRELIAALAQAVPGLKRLARLAGIEPPGKGKPAAKAAAPAKSSREARPPESKGREARGAEKKKEPERKKAPEVKKQPERKKAPEVKKEPERQREQERKKAPDERKPERKKEPEKKEPERRGAATQGRKPAARQPASPEPEEASQSPRPAHVVNFPPRPRSVLSAEEAWHEEIVEDSELADMEAPLPRPAEPLVEGFFVARVMGERELRRHHLTEDQAPRGGASSAAGFEEELGELPLDYGDDLALALARDPHTLFITWDFSPATRARALEGLESPRAVLRVFDGDRLVREEEFALESRSFYIHGLPAGRPYRVEAHFVGRAGLSRRLGHSTYPMTLPQSGPSEDTSVRFMRMPPPPPPSLPATAEIPAPVTASEPRPQQAEEREYITWRRVPLPGSAGTEEIPETLRERIPPQAPERAGPPTHLDLSARPLGASEQLAGGPQGRGGASEQSARGRPGRGGASEQTHWTPPPSGRGR